MNKWNFGRLAHGLNNGGIFIYLLNRKITLKQTRNRTTTSKQLQNYLPKAESKKEKRKR